MSTDDELAIYNKLAEDSRINGINDLLLFFEGVQHAIKKEYKMAIPKFQESLLLNEKLAYPWNGLGNVYKEQKDYEKAKESYLKAIDIDEKFAFPWNGLGNVYKEQKDYEKAKESYLKAIAIDEKYVHPWNGLGNVYKEQKDYEKAKESYLKAIDIDEKFAFPWNGLGNVYYEQKDYEKAKEAYLKAIEIDEKVAFPWNGIGNMYYMQKDYEKANEVYLKAIEIDEKFVHPWNNLGNVYKEQKDYEKAKEAYRKAIDIDEKFAVPWNGLGNLYKEQKDYEKAKEAYLKAIEIDEKYVSPWNGLGILYKKQKDYEKAKEAYLKAIEIDEKYAHAYRNYGLLLIGINEFDEAKKYFKKAISLFKSENDLYYLSVTKNNLKDVEERIEAEKAIKSIKSADPSEDPLSRLLSETKQFEEEVFNNQKEFEAFVKGSVKSDNRIYLIVLRRWNSYTPIVADNYHISKGGGYFLKIKGKGIVIDPGFNFIDNFKGAGYFFDEIDAVMVSHAHNDHTSDLESIITLLRNCNEHRKGLDDFESDDTIRADLAKNRKIAIEDIKEEEIEQAFFEDSPRRKTIDLFLTKSVAIKFGGMLNPSSKNDYRYHIIEKGDSKTLLDGALKVTAIGAKHNDIVSDQDSVGFVFDFDDTILIYTGDTGWDVEIEKQYQEIRNEFEQKHFVLLAHIGGFKDYERKYLSSNQSKEAFYKQHLGRLGLGRLVSVVKPDICLISEFGEELRQHREKLASIYGKIYTKIVFLPADIGLEYDLLEKKIRTINSLNLDKYTYEMDLTEPRDVKTCLLRKDYSLHYFDGKAPFKESDLIQVLIEEFDKSLKRKNVKLLSES
jgi:tetratricopeptide (TPR) repeat protein